MLKPTLTPQFPLPPSPDLTSNIRVYARRKSLKGGWWPRITFTLAGSRVIYFYGVSLFPGARAHTQPSSPKVLEDSEHPTGWTRRKVREREKDRRVAVSTRQETLARRETLCPVNGVTGLPWLRNPIEAVPTTAPRPLESPFILEKHYKKRRGTSHRQATTCIPPHVCPCTASLRPWVTSFRLSPSIGMILRRVLSPSAPVFPWRWRSNPPCVVQIAGWEKCHVKSEITQDGECREGGDVGRLLSDHLAEVVEGWCSKGSIRRVCVNQIEKMLVYLFHGVLWTEGWLFD